MSELRHPRAVEYAESVARHLERRAVMLRRLAELPEAEAFALDLCELAAEIEDAIRRVRTRFATLERERESSNG